MNDTYKILERRMVRYRDLLHVPAEDNGESFVRLDPTHVLNRYIRPMTDMRSIMGTRIVVRKTVAEKLRKVQSIIESKNPTLMLLITYGFRTLDVQTNIFRKISATIASQAFYKNPQDLYEEVHRYIAVPTVAGHPTGGAVDVVLVKKQTGTPLPMGSDLYDFSTKKCYTFATGIGKTAEKARLLLRTAMMQAGFAPFDGEWWHFSYGDREWAYFYKKPRALYSQQSLPQAKRLLQLTTTA